MARSLALVMALALLAGTAAAVTDADIANFALNLEYLEANFYSCAAFGKPLSSSLRGGGPAPKGCKKALLSWTAQQYAESITADEIAHVKLLRTALGDAAVAQPELDLGPAFEAAANAVLNTTLDPPFSAYGDDILFYHAAFIFEDVGVTAYKGAAPLLESKDLLETAAGVLAVEAYHGGAIRTLLLQHAYEYVFPYGAKVKDIVAAIAATRAALSGAKDDVGLLGKDNIYLLAPTDENAVAFSRTPEQVLAIVYLGGKGKGGFFPKGLNGNLK